MPETDTRQWMERIVETYSDTLLRVALHQMKNMADAEDMVQTVFLKLLRTQPEFKSPEHEKAWLIRVTVNACHDVQRSAYRKRSAVLEEGMHAEAPKEDGSLEMLDAVRALGEKYASVVYLYYYEGYSTAEIAEMLDLRKGTVESRLFRARSQLKTVLEGGWQ